MRNRVEVMNGVNLDQLGRRDPGHYGDLTHPELERLLGDWGRELGLQTRVFQTNHEGEYVEHLHWLEGMADAVILNPGSWTHYAWSIHDALEIAALPAVEVHISDIQNRDEWRRHSVIAPLCLETISGRGPEGYRLALERLARELGE
jgi:3-dehydroquinate dehydratase-2